jgi:hypothetical protein
MNVLIHQNPIPLEFEVARVDREEILIVLARQVDGSIKWKITRSGMCLDKAGHWRYEPRVSSRSRGFIAATRWDSFDRTVGAAKKAAQLYAKEIEARRKE